MVSYTLDLSKGTVRGEGLLGRGPKGLCIIAVSFGQTASTSPPHIQLMRIAKNVCIDQWRKRRPEVGYGSPGGAEALNPVVAGDIKPDLSLVVEDVWAEMSYLLFDERRCLEMRIPRYSHEETAVLIGLSVGAVKSHRQNGRRMLWLKAKGLDLLR